MLHGRMCVGVYSNGNGCDYNKAFVSKCNQYPDYIVNMFSHDNVNVRDFMHKLSEHMPYWMRPGPDMRTHPDTWKLYLRLTAYHHGTYIERFMEFGSSFEILDIPYAILRDSKQLLRVSMTPEYETSRGLVEPRVATITILRQLAEEDRTDEI